MEGAESTSEPATRLSSVTGPARWVALGVVGLAGVGGAVWTYAVRVPRPMQPLPEAVVVPRREIGTTTSPLGRDHAANVPMATGSGLWPAMSGAVEPLGGPGADQQADERALDSQRVADRAMIIWRSRLGPHVAEAESVLVEQSAASAAKGGEVSLAEQAARQLLMEQRRKEAAEAGDAPNAPASSPKSGASGNTAAKGGVGGGATAGAGLTGKLINVNKATQAELELLPDVGPALAKRIVEYRSQQGAFKSFEDLDKVRGIGPKTIEKFKGRVVFSDPPPK